MLRDVDQIIEAAERSILQTEFQKASRQAVWDGYGGLVRVCDDDHFTEQRFHQMAPREEDRASTSGVSLTGRALARNTANSTARGQSEHPSKRSEVIPSWVLSYVIAPSSGGSSISVLEDSAGPPSSTEQENSSLEDWLADLPEPPSMAHKPR